MTHTKATFKSIPCRVLNRIEKLNPGIEKNSNIRVNEIQPGHNMALTKSGINMKTFPTQEESW